MVKLAIGCEDAVTTIFIDVVSEITGTSFFYFKVTRLATFAHYLLEPHIVRVEDMILWEEHLHAKVSVHVGEQNVADSFQ